jgi:hypothetical protein
MGLLRIDEAPDFIDLQPLAGEVAEGAILVLGTGATNIGEQLCHCVLAGPGDPRNGCRGGS